MNSPLATTSPTLAHVAFVWQRAAVSRPAKRRNVGHRGGTRPPRGFLGPPERSRAGAARGEKPRPKDSLFRLSEFL